MSCPAIHDWELYAAGALGAERADACTRHLEACADCQATLAAITALDERLASAHAVFGARHELDRDALMAALPAPAARPAAWLGSALRIAAAIAVMVSCTWWWSRSVAHERQLVESGMVVEFVLGHTGDALGTVERIAVGEVIGDQVSETIGHMPLGWVAPPVEQEVER